MNVKDIRIKYTGTNGSGTFSTVPGSTGDLSLDAERIDDTILGENYSSEYPGLIEWTLSTTAYYKGHAGYEAQIKKEGAEMSAQSLELTMEAEEIDVSDLPTVQANKGFRVKEPGLRTVEVTVSGFYKNMGLIWDLQKRDIVVITIKPSYTESDAASGYFYMVSDGLSGDVGPPENEELTFSLATQESIDSSSSVPSQAFNWETSNLPEAITDSIHSFLNHESLGVGYLPQGTDNDSSGGGAVHGRAFVSSLGLSAGTDGNVEFSIDLVGAREVS